MRSGSVSLLVVMLVASSVPAMASEIPPMELVGQYGGQVDAIDVQGDYAYVGQDQSLVVYDISEYRQPHPPGSTPLPPPERLGSIVVPDRVTDVVVADERVYLAATKAGFRVVDVSDPWHPTLVYAYEPELWITSLAVQGEMAFVGECRAPESALLVFGLSEPFGPRLVGQARLYNNHSPVRVQIDGQRAYVSCGDISYTTIVICDISSPSEPVALPGRLFPSEMNYSDFRVSNGRGYFLFTQNRNRFLGVFDLSVAGQATLIEQLAFPRTSPRWRVLEVQNDVAFLRDDYKSLLILDEQAIEGADLSNVITLDDSVWRRYPTSRLHIADGLLLVGTGSEMLRGYDVTNTESPILLGGTPCRGKILDVSPTHNRAYVTYKPYYPSSESQGNSMIGRIEALDISNLSDPRSVGALLTVVELESECHYYYDTDFQADTAYVVSSQRKEGTAIEESGVLSIHDFRDPVQPAELGHIDLDFTVPEMIVSGDIAYLRSGEELITVDISDPAAPVPLASLELADSTETTLLSIADNRAYLSGKTGRGEAVVNIVDISDPRSPSLAVTYTPSETGIDAGVTQFVRYGNLAIVTGHRSCERVCFDDLNILDISNEIAPRHVYSDVYMYSYTYVYPEYSGIDYAHGTLYLANCRLDLADPRHPIFFGGFGGEGSIHTKDGLVYFCSDGLKIFSEHRFPLVVSFQGQGAVDPPPCDRMVNEGEALSITATPAENWRFVGWTGDVAGDPAANPLAVTMDAKKTITAVFEEIHYNLEIAEEGHGFTNPAPGIHSLLHDTVVNVTATADSGWEFDHWEGNYSGDATADSTTVTMTGDKSLRAVFVPVMFTLTMNATGSGTTSPEIGAHTLATETAVNAVAMPAEGWRFVRWEGDIVGEPITNPMAFILDTDTSLTAVFEPIPRTLTLFVEGSGIIDPAPGQYVHPHGTSIVLKATAGSGWRFDHWDSGGLKNSADNPATITMNGDKAITAVFVPIRHILTLQVQGNGVVHPGTGDFPYDEGADAEIAAEAGEDWQFDHWEGDIGLEPGNSPSLLIGMTQDRAITAVFVSKKCTLDVQVQGGGTTEPAAGAYVLERGTNLSLAACAGRGWEFDHWEGVDADQAALENITIPASEDTTVTAVFVECPDDAFGCAGEPSDNRNLPASVGDVTLLGVAAVGLLARGWKRRR